MIPVLDCDGALDILAAANRFDSDISNNEVPEVVVGLDVANNEDCVVTAVEDPNFGVVVDVTPNNDLPDVVFAVDDPNIDIVVVVEDVPNIDVVNGDEVEVKVAEPIVEDIDKGVFN
ncbi:hypothetical protein EVAR_84388_1 [Eumeta japonica]|uniref:Uncharacterized protein n=1 Tax=Eumeta variegata TaxID=151549 RepID=A0A4C1U4M3_EUMVA|nr:hypothetical protein EVAR_84388_1 [Eumeta japonica]